MTSSKIDEYRNAIAELRGAVLWRRSLSKPGRRVHVSLHRVFEEHLADGRELVTSSPTDAFQRELEVVLRERMYDLTSDVIQRMHGHVTKLAEAAKREQETNVRAIACTQEALAEELERA